MNSRHLPAYRRARACLFAGGLGGRPLGAGGRQGRDMAAWNRGTRHVCRVPGDRGAALDLGSASLAHVLVRSGQYQAGTDRR